MCFLIAASQHQLPSLLHLLVDESDPPLVVMLTVGMKLVQLFHLLQGNELQGHPSPEINDIRTHLRSIRKPTASKTSS